MHIYSEIIISSILLYSFLKFPPPKKCTIHFFDSVLGKYSVQGHNSTKLFAQNIIDLASSPVVKIIVPFGKFCSLFHFKYYCHLGPH